MLFYRFWIFFFRKRNVYVSFTLFILSDPVHVCLSTSVSGGMVMLYDKEALYQHLPCEDLRLHFKSCSFSFP